MQDLHNSHPKGFLPRRNPSMHVLLRESAVYGLLMHGVQIRGTVYSRYSLLRAIRAVS